MVGVTARRRRHALGRGKGVVAVATQRDLDWIADVVDVAGTEEETVAALEGCLVRLRAVRDAQQQALQALSPAEVRAAADGPAPGADRGHTMSPAQARAAVSVAELQRAWAAVQTGAFRPAGAPIASRPGPEPLAVQTGDSAAACGWGNLQAPLDEYVHHLVVSEGIQVLDDERLLRLARTAADAIAMRVSQYEAFDPTAPQQPILFPSRFALRYGGRRVTQENVRQPVRQAFNSPFWPFVLASTSVGQEGIDLHWWCHAVVHWNTPANPVDFEQREGRVNRYGGHAVRLNIAARHGPEILASGAPNPWRAAYTVATAERERCGDFAPHWVYPGPAKIERHLLPTRSVSTGPGTSG